MTIEMKVIWEQLGEWINFLKYSFRVNLNRMTSDN